MIAVDVVGGGVDTGSVDLGVVGLWSVEVGEPNRICMGTQEI